ncbi:hypothetical protein [Actinoplanes sp. URMC 104]|uniref:hypothetical protein n=1 Tax=Actinoplanes sp. URMC 104 TaxID=3423409 RepID=UPI003F1BC5F0
MLRSITGTAGALSLALLLAGGCSSDDDPAASGAVPVSAGESAAAAASAGAQPTADATEPGSAGSAAAQPGEAGTAETPPSRPAGHVLPNPDPANRGWITATVTGGSGKCWTFRSADGETWSVYSAKQVPLSKGDKVRARLTPGKTPVDCGSGKAATLGRLLIAEG